MINCETCLINFASKFLPPMAKLLELKKPYKKPAILIADLDGDGILEIIAAYKLIGECYVIIIKKYNNIWRVAANIKGKGYDINYLDSDHIVDEKTNNLIIGWQMGAIWAELSIFQWTSKDVKNIVKGHMSYSKIEVQDMLGGKDRDGKAEIALWKHDTGEAYDIEVLRWDNGKFITALDVYPYYFKKVKLFYEQKVREMPDAAFYWYHLADAQLKAEMAEQALKSVHMAMKLVMKFNYEYPSGDDLIKLEKEILDKLQNRNIIIHQSSQL